MRIAVLTVSTILLLICVSGCIPSGQQEHSEAKYPDLVQINLPNGEEREKSQLYIDSVEKIEHRGSQALIIKGSFPDACTHIQSASHSSQSEMVEIEIKAWRELNTMCAQALTSFSFIYEGLSDSLLNITDDVIVNDKRYKIP